MRNSMLFPRLAAVSMRKNGRFYIPYLLTCVAAAAMYYIMWYLRGNEGLNSMRGTEYVALMLSLGCVVIAIFSAILLFYTNSFLMKRRKKELGLYNILGMEKRHIAQVMLWETVYTALIGIVGGIVVGMLLSKLLLLLLCALLRFDVQFGFTVSVTGIVNTAAFFAVIFALNLLSNLHGVSKAKPIELLYSGSTAEREPKTKWILTLIGLVTLGAGYYIALTVADPVSAIVYFMLAVILVIIGTYCLFTSGSIAFLKLLRKNKGYYYKTRHFITVSGMLHRMKRNAAGLASIAILSTMVLVTVSCTLCLYVGEEATLNERYPYDVSFCYRNASDATVEAATALIKEQAAAGGVSISQPVLSRMMQINTLYNGGALEYTQYYNLEDENCIALIVLSYDSYASMCRAEGQGAAPQPQPKAGEVYAQILNADIKLPDALTFGGDTYKIAGGLPDFVMRGEVGTYTMKMLQIVVCDDDFNAVYSAAAAQCEAMLDGKDLTPYKVYVETGIGVDIDGSDEDEIAFADKMYGMLSEGGEHVLYEYDMFYSESRADNSYEFYVMYGGFFFLGLFLGTLFLMATVLIIYYKQVSEGYEDAERYKIMQQVGMSASEVRGSITTQILTVFFLPLAAAAIHILAAFGMLTKMIAVFNLYNVGLFALCCIGTFAVFAAIYMLIYTLTARAYYRIVKN